MPMTMLILSTGTICAALALVHLASIIAAIVRVRTPIPVGWRANVTDGVSIIRPVCGIENFSEATLKSAFSLTYPRYEILFCAAQGNDPVLPLVRRLIAAHPSVPARLLIGNECISANPKLNNVVKGWAAARYRWIVMADSNVLMPPDYIQRLLATWRHDAGLVCSPPIGIAPDGFWAELECAFLNTYQARWQYVADTLGIGFAQGKTMLWRRDILEAGGGIRALAAEVAEDAASTKLIRSLGLRVRLANAPFAQPLGTRSAGEVWRRQLRWARLRRHTFQLFFIPELFTGALVPLVACLACASSADLPVAAIVGAFLAFWYGAEALLAYAAGWHLSHWSPAAWMFRDLLLPVLWCTSWASNDFVWRGHMMRVADRGSLT
jgi:ceramide glucosyltransferase